MRFNSDHQDMLSFHLAPPGGSIASSSLLCKLKGPPPPPSAGRLLVARFSTFSARQRSAAALTCGAPFPYVCEQRRRIADDEDKTVSTRGMYTARCGVYDWRFQIGHIGAALDGLL